MDRLRELRLPRAERAAARAERRVMQQIRTERDNPERPEHRAAALEAEARKYTPRGVPGFFKNGGGVGRF
jgi:hypothetical protein